MPSPVSSWNTVRAHVNFYDRAGLKMLKAGTYKVTIAPTVTNTPDDGVIPGGIYAQGDLNQAPGAPSFDLQVPATDDPDNSPLGFKVRFDFTFTDGSSPISMVLDIPVALSGNADGLNLRNFIDTSSLPSTEVAGLVRGVPGGVAALNGQGQVVDAAGNLVAGLVSNSPAHVVTTSGSAQAVPAPSSTVGYVHQYGLDQASCAFTLPTGLTDINGQPAQADLALYLVNSGGGARDFTVPSSVTWDDNGKPTLPTTAGKTLIVAFTTMDGGATWLASGPALVATPYTDEQAQDAAAALILAGNHTGVSWVYDDTGNKLSATVTATGGGAPSVVILSGGPAATSTADLINGGAAA